MGATAMFDEARRLESLRELAVLDTAPEERFDRLTRLAAELFDAPMAAVSLIDAERQWFKSKVGLDADETPREQAFCDHAIRLGPNATMVVEDATLDPRFARNPLVTGDPGIRFYCGATLTSSDGHNLGALCVIDRAPRPTPSARDLERLRMLARMVMDELELGRARQALAEQASLLELAEAMSGVGHWRYECADGRIRWSDEVYAIHGVDRRRFDPNYDEAMAHYLPDDRVVVHALVARAISHGEDYAFQVRLLRPDGELRHVSCKAACQVAADGSTAAIVGVFQDITEHVRARAEAEAAAAVKSAFLANMSHELRTPLTGILGFAELLGKDTSLSDEARLCASHITDGSTALLAIVNDVLDFSKLEAGQVDIHPCPTDPAETLRAALALLVPQAVRKSLTIALDCDGLPPRLMIDEARMRQILLNLGGNALKFTEEGGVTVRATYAAATQTLRCEIVDTGPGVPEDQLERLFKRFSQVDASATRKYGGAGLGLAICKGLAEAMGGRVGADSVSGRGSVFWFELPAPAPRAAADIRGLRVLVVDDTLVSREMTRMILQAAGADVIAVDNTDDLLELIGDPAFDAVLAAGSAVEAIARIMAGRAPVFGLGDDQASSPLGAEGWLALPLAPTALAEALAALPT